MWSTGKKKKNEENITLTFIDYFNIFKISIEVIFICSHKSLKGHVFSKLVFGLLI